MYVDSVCMYILLLMELLHYGDRCDSLAGRPVCSLTPFEGHMACLPRPSENGKKLQANQVFWQGESRTTGAMCSDVTAKTCDVTYTVGSNSNL